MTPPIFEAKNVVKNFPIKGGILNRTVSHVHAVNDVSLKIYRGETVGLVGESGCGKTTFGKTLVRLYEPTAGDIYYQGQSITTASEAQLRPLRRRFQIVFQDPYASLNPRMTVEQMLREAIRFHSVVPAEETGAYIDQLLDRCGLSPEMKTRYPHEFSGGQRQRIGIARALSVKPEFILADEPVSALDVSIQAQLLNLMMDLREQFGLTYLFISHDLKVVEHFCDRVVIMYLGKVVETLTTEDLYTQARHPYTRALLGAIPIDDPSQRSERTPLQGDVPSPSDLPPGCFFASRCPQAQPSCREQSPELVQIKTGHEVACPIVL